MVRVVKERVKRALPRRDLKGRQCIAHTRNDIKQAARELDKLAPCMRRKRRRQHTRRRSSAAAVRSLVT